VTGKMEGEAIKAEVTLIRQGDHWIATNVAME
jgi:hypothetical protein